MVFFVPVFVIFVPFVVIFVSFFVFCVCFFVFLVQKCVLIGIFETSLYVLFDLNIIGYCFFVVIKDSVSVFYFF